MVGLTDASTVGFYTNDLSYFSALAPTSACVPHWPSASASRQPENSLSRLRLAPTDLVDTSQKREHEKLFLNTGRYQFLSPLRVTLRKRRPRWTEPFAGCHKLRQRRGFNLSTTRLLIAIANGASKHATDNFETVFQFLEPPCSWQSRTTSCVSEAGRAGTISTAASGRV